MGFLRKSAGVLAVMVIAAGTCYAADKVENPEYKKWAKFKVGSSVIFELQTPTAGKPSRPILRTMTLLEITPEKVVVEDTATAGSSRGKIEIPAKIEKEEKPAIDPKAEVQEIVKESEISGTKIKVKITEIKIGGQLISKTRTSDDIPGGVLDLPNTIGFWAITTMTIK